MRPADAPRSFNELIGSNQSTGKSYECVIELRTVLG